MDIVWGVVEEADVGVRGTGEAQDEVDDELELEVVDERE